MYTPGFIGIAESRVENVRGFTGNIKKSVLDLLSRGRLSRLIHYLVQKTKFIPNKLG